VSAEREISVPRERVFRFLADLGCHWRLSDAAIELHAVRRERDGAHGIIELHPPVPVDRTAVTELQRVQGGAIVAGTVRMGMRTSADVTWSLDSRGRSTLVRLTAVVRRAGPLDRVLLRVGGAWWLGRRFRVVLARLERELDSQPPPPSGSAGG
jgi:polyketide cyclase/dehydrase/lipid transport protein